MVHWWTSPLEIADGGNVLLPGATKYNSGSKSIQKSGMFCVDMRRVFVNISKDGRNDRIEHLKNLINSVIKGNDVKNTNDLLIVSSFQTGTSPTVQRIHYLMKDKPVNEMMSDFYKTLVCSFGDFKDNHITLQVQVYDIDDHEDIKEFVKNASSMAGNLTGTFPVIAPYIAIGTAVATGITSLISNIEEHDKIIDQNLRLTITKENTGYNILQTGHWVCFEKELPMEKMLVLDPHMAILHKDSREPFIDCSYAIYTIRGEDAAEPNWEIDQKVAKLLSELEGKGNSGKAPVDFLRDTMEGYTAFKKLKRIQQLEKKGNARTEEENSLLTKLKSDEKVASFL
jgi:hypothetical protein